MLHRAPSHLPLIEDTAAGCRPEMDMMTAECRDDGGTSLQLDLGDTGAYVL